MAVINSGLGNVPLPADTHSFPIFFLKRIEEYGNRLALIDSTTSRSYTFAELNTLIKKCASLLVKQGAQIKDMFAILLPNILEYPIVFYGVTSIGAIVTTINPGYTVSEIVYQLKDSGAKYIITVPQLAEKAKEAGEKSGIRRIYTFGKVDGCASLIDLLMKEDGTSFPDHVSVDWKEDIVCLPYSSGTTGLPKGVMLTHYNLIAHAIMFNKEEILHVPETGVTSLGLLPLFHSYGLSVIMGVFLIKGATVVTMSQFEPAAFLEAIQKHKINVAPIVPPIALFLAKHPMIDKYDMTSLREILSAAAPLGGEVISAVRARFPQVQIFRQGYGLTETSPACTVSLADGSKSSSVGVLLPNLKAKVIDLKSGALLPAGIDGEICISGPTVMKGYFNKPEATAQTIDSEGWLHTGDVGHYDEDGHFYVVDRIKELIKYKGFQVPPAELEDLLLSHPSITDAAVIGVPDEKAGELPKAVIVTSGELTEREVQEFVAQRVAAHKKLRGGVEFAKSVPKNASGKIMRRLLRDRERERVKKLPRHKL